MESVPDWSSYKYRDDGIYLAEDFENQSILIAKDLVTNNFFVTSFLWLKVLMKTLKIMFKKLKFVV